MYMDKITREEIPIPDIRDHEHAQSMINSLGVIKQKQVEVNNAQMAVADRMFARTARKAAQVDRLQDMLMAGYNADDTSANSVREIEGARRLNRKLMGLAPKFRASVLPEKPRVGSDVAVYDPLSPRTPLQRRSTTAPTNDIHLQKSLEHAREEGYREGVKNGRRQAVAENAALETALEQARKLTRSYLDTSIDNFEKHKASLAKLARDVQQGIVSGEAAKNMALDIINVDDLASFIAELRDARVEIARRLRSPTLIDDIDKLKETQRKISDTLADCESVNTALLKIRPIGTKTFLAYEVGNLIKTTENKFKAFKEKNPNVASELEKAVVGDNNTELVRTLKSGLYPIYFDLKDYIREYKTHLLTNPNTHTFIKFIDSDQQHIRRGFWDAVSQLQNSNETIRMHPDVARRVKDLPSEDRHRLLALADLMALAKEIKESYDFRKIKDLTANLARGQGFKRGNKGDKPPKEAGFYTRRDSNVYGDTESRSDGPVMRAPLALGFDADSAKREATARLDQLGADDI